MISPEKRLLFAFNGAFILFLTTSVSVEVVILAFMTKVGDSRVTGRTTAQ